MATQGADKHKAVILLSGGMDSVITAAVARAKGRQLYALSLDYGQRHRHELQAARWQAKRLGVVKHVVLRLPLGPIASGALVDGGAIRTSGVKAGQPSTYVSFRNGVFLAAAASYAESVGANEVWGGWCFSDQGGYPDCTPAFFRAFERAVSAGTWAGRKGQPFRIVAPLGRLDKAASVARGLKLGVDYAHTWTCYQPQGQGARSRPCRRCDACRLRAAGFADLHLSDPQADPRP